MTTARVSDIAEQIRGVTFAKGDSVDKPKSGYLPVLTASNITENGLKLDSVLYIPEQRISSRQLLQPNDVVITASSGSLSVVGRAALFDGSIQAGFGAFCKVLRPGSKVDPNYFAHFFKTPEYRSEVSRLAAGANINNLRNEDLDGFRIPLPPLPEQRRIASILDQADALRARRRHALALLDVYAEVSFDAILREGTKGKGDAVTLGHVADIQTGPFGSLLHREDYISGGVPLINPTHIKDGQINIDSEYSITDEKFETLRSYELVEGDVVLGRRGEMGRAAEVPELSGRLICGTGSMILRPKKGVVTGAVLAKILRSNAVREQLTQRAQGVTMLNLNQTIVAGIAVVLPVFENQISVSQLKTTTQVAKMRHVQHLAHLDELFASLQSRAFKGEL